MREVNDSIATILVVDDSLTNLELVEAILQHNGYEVITANSASKAIEILENFTPQLILADIMMPVMSGYEFYEYIRKIEHLRTIPFVFLTAKGKRADIQYGKELGVDDYLTKPFSRQDLLVSVKNKLNRAREYGFNTKQQLERLKDEILRSLSHEFKTPLTVIKGSVDLMSRKSEKIQSEDYLEDIRHSSERLEKLVDDFMLMVKAESGMLETEFKKKKIPINLEYYLPFILNSYYSLSDELNIDYELNIAENIPIIEVCEKHLSISLGKLLDNAFKFTSHQDGYVKVNCFVEQKHVIISIKNNGLKIPEQYHNKVFEKFFQIDRDKYEQQGTGVGLSIAKFLIELNGGKIEIKQTRESETCFELQFPHSSATLKDKIQSDGHDNNTFFL